MVLDDTSSAFVGKVAYHKTRYSSRAVNGLLDAWNDANFNAFCLGYAWSPVEREEAASESLSLRKRSGIGAIKWRKQNYP
jgi:hypothetical protein